MEEFQSVASAENNVPLIGSPSEVEEGANETVDEVGPPDAEQYYYHTHEYYSSRDNHWVNHPPHSPSTFVWGIDQSHHAAHPTGGVYYAVVSPNPYGDPSEQGHLGGELMGGDYALFSSSPVHYQSPIYLSSDLNDRNIDWGTPSSPAQPSYSVLSSHIRQHQHQQQQHLYNVPHRALPLSISPPPPSSPVSFHSSSVGGNGNRFASGKHAIPMRPRSGSIEVKDDKVVTDGKTLGKDDKDRQTTDAKYDQTSRRRGLSRKRHQSYQRTDTRGGGGVGQGVRLPTSGTVFPQYRRVHARAGKPPSVSSLPSSNGGLDSKIEMTLESSHGEVRGRSQERKRMEIKERSGGGGGGGKMGKDAAEEERSRYLCEFLRNMEKTRRSNICSIYVFKMDSEGPPILEAGPEFTRFCEEVLTTTKYPPMGVAYKTSRLRKMVRTAPHSSYKPSIGDVPPSSSSPPPTEEIAIKVTEDTVPGALPVTSPSPSPTEATGLSGYFSKEFYRVFWVLTYEDHATATAVGRGILERLTIFSGDPVYCKWAYKDPFF